MITTRWIHSELGFGGYVNWYKDPIVGHIGIGLQFGTHIMMEIYRRFMQMEDKLPKDVKNCDDGAWASGKYLKT